MSIAVHAERSAKLRRSGIVSGSLLPEVCENQNPAHAAPTELGWESAVVIATNIALRTELAPLASPNKPPQMQPQAQELLPLLVGPLVPSRPHRA